VLYIYIYIYIYSVLLYQIKFINSYFGL
jgi:hypothetical protein